MGGAPLAERIRARLRAARVQVGRAGPVWQACVLGAVAAIFLYVARIPARIDELRTPSDSVAAALSRTNVEPETFARIVVALEISVVAGAALLAAIVFAKEKKRRWGGFVGFMLAVLAAALPVSDLLVSPQGHVSELTWWLAGVAWSCVFVFLYRFPDGVYRPWWIELVAYLRVAEILAGTAFRGTMLNSYNWPAEARLAESVFWFSTVLAVQAYRYRTASKMERQQATGLTLAVVILIVGVLTLAAPPVLFPQLASTGFVLLIQPVTYLIGLVAVLAVALGAYQPWAVDSVVKRTAVYLALSAVLAGIYGLCVEIFGVLLADDDSKAPIVIATFVVVVLLSPIKDGLQWLVDKYVKERTDPIESVRSLTRQALTVAEVVDVQRLGERILKEAMSAFGTSSGALRIEGEERSEAALTWDRGEAPEDLRLQHPPNGKPVAVLKLGRRDSNADYSEQEQRRLEELLPEIARAVKLAARRSIQR